MIMIFLRPVRVLRGYEIERIIYEDEDMYSYTVAKDRKYITLCRGKKISEEELEWLREHHCVIVTVLKTN